MTLEQKVGQMFMVSLYGAELSEAGAAFIRQQQPGAVAIFGYNADGRTPQQVAALINQMQAVATENGGVPLIIATDQEGGRVQRITNGMTVFPDPLYLGAVTNDAALERIGAVMGAELAALGINMNLAPVADLHTRGDMLSDVRVMHRRTFGDNPERVGEQAAAYVEGLRQAGVIGVVKHFPGHGGAADSHADLPRVLMDAETAAAQPFRAFEVAVANGVPSVMVSHLYYSQVEPVPDLPASLSPTMLGMLREDFGFDGVIMTDAMDMAALANRYYVPDAALMFVQAGGDMIVTGPWMAWGMQRAAMGRIIEAVKNGDLDEHRVDESVRRILQLKADYGLLEWRPIDAAAVKINHQTSRAALIETFMDAATVVRDVEHLLPLQPTDRVAIVYPAIYGDIQAACSELAPQADFHGYIFDPADWEFSTVAQLGRQHDKMVIFTEDAYLNQGQQELIKPLPPEKTVVVAMSLPYDLEVIGEVSTFMALYANLPVSQIAACNVLFGQHPITGRLPIAVGEYATGSGITLQDDGVE